MSATTTSRVGRKPIHIPSGVDIKIQDQQVLIKGPKGQSAVELHPWVKAELANGELQLAPNTQDKYCRPGVGVKLRQSITGTIRSKINNAVAGVSKGYERKLVLVGVGYKAQMKGKTLNIAIGFSHPVDYPVPEGLTIETPSPTEIVIKGTDKNLVGQTAATIRGIRAPEPYKGKGIRYSYEVINLKETKKK